MSNQRDSTNFHTLESSDAPSHLGWRHRWALIAMTLLSGFTLSYFVSMPTIVPISLSIFMLLNLRSGQTVWGFAFLTTIVFFRFGDPTYFRETTLVSNAAFCLLAVGYLSLFCRLGQQVKYAVAYDIDERETGSDAPSILSLISSLVSTRWYLGLITILLAAVFLLVNPDSERSVYAYGLQSEWGRLIFLILFLFIFWYGMRSILSVVAFFNLTPDVAEIATRADINSEFWRESSGIEYRRAKKAVIDTEGPVSQT